MQAIQSTFDDLGTPLAGVTFVVVDLETTGGTPAQCGITEIGAVKVRGGEQLGEFQTLVNPAEPIPAFISVLTGITDSMVRDAPRIDSALPAFLEFAAGSVLVAHNAGFDIGFLKAAAARVGLRWPGFPVLDTLQLARQLVVRDESPNHRLSSLAQVFGSPTTPDHRALHDARATVDVLHGLIERVGNLGVHTLEELSSYSSRVTPSQRRKRFLADPLPSAPGVYLFKDGSDRVLYVGTSRDIRTRVRSYFTASEQRSRMAEMVRLAQVVHPIVCQTSLEAQVRELRLIDEHKPRFNRRSKNGRKVMWVKLTQERFPRLSIVKQVRDDDAHYIGPFRSRVTAQSAIDAVHEVVPLRQCTGRLTGRGTACALADMGRCGAPCTGAQSEGDYAVVVDECRAIFTGNARPSARAAPCATRGARLAGALRGRGAGARPLPAARTRCGARPAARAARALPRDRRGPSQRPRGLGARLHTPRSPGRHRGEPARSRPDALRPLDAGHRRGRAALHARAAVRAHRGDRDPAALARGSGRAHRRARRDVDLPGRRRRLGAQRARTRRRLGPRRRRLRQRRAAPRPGPGGAGGRSGRAGAAGHGPGLRRAG